MGNFGIPRENIKLVTSAKEAQELLLENKFDLFILDILLPLWSEDDGISAMFSQEILLSLYKSNEYIKPRLIIGITGDKSTVTEELLNFESHLLGVVEYSATCNEWEDRIINAISYIHNIESGEVNDTVDLAIICALKDPELSAILELDWNWQDSKPLSDKLFYKRGHFFSNGKSYSVVVASCERMGMVSATFTSSAIIHRFRPKVIAMTGICAGIKGEVNLGDIIFASFAWDYQQGKRMENGEHLIDPHQLPSSASIKAHAELLQDDKDFFHNMILNYKGNKSHIVGVPKLHIGPIAVGSSVIADSAIVQSIQSQQRKALGIEMEIYGLYYAAINSSSPTPQVFAIKSVCDFADSLKSDNYQSYASYTSANTLKELFERYAHQLIN
ncbi:TPA: hypothetical protein ACGF4W_001742 [Vibrio cholerae]